MTVSRGRGIRKAPRAVRPLLVTVGVVFMGLGIAGVFIPLLPTTPFLLLAAACFLRSSDRFYAWLMANRWVGSYLRSYMEHRATTVRAKVWSVTTLWCCLALAGVFFTESWWVRSLLLVVAVGVTIHLLRLRTIREDAAGDGSRDDGVRERRASWQTRSG